MSNNKQIEKHLELPHQETIVGINTIQTNPFDNQKTIKMSNNKQYIVFDIINKEFFKDFDGNVKRFENYDDAYLHCSFYELENVWICQLIYNYKEDETFNNNESI